MTQFFSVCVSVSLHLAHFISGDVLSSRCSPRLRLRFSFAVLLFLRWVSLEEFLCLGSFWYLETHRQAVQQNSTDIASIRRFMTIAPMSLAYRHVPHDLI